MAEESSFGESGARLDKDNGPEDLAERFNERLCMDGRWGVSGVEEREESSLLGGRNSS